MLPSELEISLSIERSRSLVWIQAASAFAVALALLGVPAVSAALVPAAVMAVRSIVAARRSRQRLSSGSADIRPLADDIKPRYFVFSDGDTHCYVVAHDHEHARRILIDAGIEFGDPGVDLERAEAMGEIASHELTPDQADVVPVRVTLSDNDIGAFFCTEV